MLAVHIRVNDSQTHQSIPVRISITSATGESFAPLGQSPIFPLGTAEDVGGRVRQGTENAFHIPGTCEIRLPAGQPLHVRIVKGLEYRPLDQIITLGTGQMALRFELKRWWDRSQSGWMSADARAHFLTPHAAVLESAAEDLDLTNLLIREHYYLASDGNTYQTAQHLPAWSGQRAALTSDATTIVVNTLNSHRTLGNVGLLHSHRPIFPLAFGEPYSTDDWSIIDWCQQCHRKKGLTTWVDAFQPEGGETLLAAILGQIDALEWSATPRKHSLLPWYYRLLNAGIRIPLVGASGKSNNRLALGSMRTYAQVEGTDRTYSNWIEVVRKGRTFITNGPIIQLIQDGNRWNAVAECLTRFEKMELICDGSIIATTDSHQEQERSMARLNFEFPPAFRWIAIRCVGGPSPLDSTATNFAHTSPLFGTHQDRDPQAIQSLIESIDRVREWATTQAQFTEAKWREQLLRSCREAEERLLRS